MRHRWSVSSVVVLLVAASLLTGCGRGAGTAVGQRHFSLFQAAICGYTAYRTVHDLRTGHRFAGAFNAYLALHHCPRVTH